MNINEQKTEAMNSIRNVVKAMVSSKTEAVFTILKEGLEAPSGGFSKKQQEVAARTLDSLQQQLMQSLDKDENALESAIETLDTCIKAVDIIYSQCEDEEGSGMFKELSMTKFKIVKETLEKTLHAISLPKDEAITYLRSLIVDSWKEADSSDNDTDTYPSSSQVMLNKSYVDNVDFWWNKYKSIVVITPYPSNTTPEKYINGDRTVFDPSNKNMVKGVVVSCAASLDIEPEDLLDELKCCININVPAEWCLRSKAMFGVINAALQSTFERSAGKIEPGITVSVGVSVKAKPGDEIWDDAMREEVDMKHVIPCVAEALAVYNSETDKCKCGKTSKSSCSCDLDGITVSEIDPEELSNVKQQIADLQIPDEIVSELKNKLQGLLGKIINKDDDK